MLSPEPGVGFFATASAVTRGSIGLAAVLGIVIGSLLGGLFAAALDGHDQSAVDQTVAVRAPEDSPEDASAEAPLGLIGGATANEAAPTTIETPTPVAILPPPTAGSTAPPATPTQPPPPISSEAAPQEATATIDADVLSCSDNYVAITHTAIDSAAEIEGLFDELANNPQTRAADVAKSCASLAVDDQASFVAYIGPFANAVDACVTATNAGARVGVVRLSAASGYSSVLRCPSFGGFMTHQGRFFVADVPQDATLTASDLDVGYGFRTKYEGPDYFVTIETSRNQVPKSGASAKQSAAGVAESVANASELRQVMIAGIEVWYFEFVADGFFKVDLFFYVGDDGYAVIGADKSSMDVAFGLASHTVASLQPITS